MYLSKKLGKKIAELLQERDVYLLMSQTCSLEKHTGNRSEDSILIQKFIMWDDKKLKVNEELAKLGIEI